MIDAETAKNHRLNNNLFVLGLNFNTLDPVTRETFKEFTPPTDKQAKTFYAENNEIHPLLLAMIASEDAAKKLYGAILLFEFDEAKATKVLQKLSADKTVIKVQKLLGFGSTNIEVKHLATSFLKTGDIHEGFLEKKEASDNWQLSIYRELDKRGSGKFKHSTFPEFEEFWEGRENEAEREKLIEQIAGFADDEIISKRLYAAFLLKELNSDKGTEILESLLNNESMIPVLRGDIIHEFPAKELAAEMLYGPLSDEEIRQKNNQYSGFHKNIINKIFGIFSK